MIFKVLKKNSAFVCLFCYFFPFCFLFLISLLFALQFPSCHLVWVRLFCGFLEQKLSLLVKSLSLLEASNGVNVHLRIAFTAASKLLDDIAPTTENYLLMSLAPSSLTHHVLNNALLTPKAQCLRFSSAFLLLISSLISSYSEHTVISVLFGLQRLAL